MNGFYDTAVIMPSFQNDPYQYEYRSDESDEEFISDDEFIDTPIFLGEQFVPAPSVPHQNGGQQTAAEQKVQGQQEESHPTQDSPSGKRRG